jgi:hypothetical protein
MNQLSKLNQMKGIYSGDLFGGILPKEVEDIILYYLNKCYERKFKHRKEIITKSLKFQDYCFRGLRKGEKFNPLDKFFSTNKEDDVSSLDWSVYDKLPLMDKFQSYKIVEGGEGVRKFVHFKDDIISLVGCSNHFTLEFFNHYWNMDESKKILKCLTELYWKLKGRTREKITLKSLGQKYKGNPNQLRRDNIIMMTYIMTHYRDLQQHGQGLLIIYYTLYNMKSKAKLQRVKDDWVNTLSWIFYRCIESNYFDTKTEWEVEKQKRAYENHTWFRKELQDQEQLERHRHYGKQIELMKHFSVPISYHELDRPPLM